MYQTPDECLPPWPEAWNSESVLLAIPQRKSRSISVAQFFEAVDATLSGGTLEDQRVDAVRVFLCTRFEEVTLHSHLSKLNIN